MNDASLAESGRLRALASYTILDTLPEEEYDAITRIAAQVCQMPVSLITLLDDHRQWFKSAHGLPIRETRREYAFCDYAIRTPGQLLEVTDARTDERFANNPLTTGDPHVIFYAGVPLVDVDGQALGTLCVIDHKPNKLSVEQAVVLRALASQVVTQLQLRRSQSLLEQANQKLQDNNQILQAVVDNCPAGLVLWEAIRESGIIVDFRYKLTNPVNARLTSLSVSQLTGQSLKGLFPGVMSNGLFERLVAVVETGQCQHYEQFEEFDQINVWGDFTIVPVHPDRVLFTIQDITPLKRIEAQLRTHTEHLAELVNDRTAEIRQLSGLQNAILENAGLAIISSDVNGTILTVNPAACQLLHYRADELIGQTNPAFLFDSGELARQAQLIAQHTGYPVKPDFDLFKAMMSRQRYECTVVRKDGRQIPILMITTALRNETGTITGYVAMGTDISDLKSARAALKRKNHELNTFFEVALDLHCIADTSGTILKANQAWQTVLGYTVAELAAINHYDLVHPDDRHATLAALTQFGPQQSHYKNTNRFRRKDGTYRLIEWHVVSANGLLYASARDITDHKRASDALQESEQRFREITEQVDELFWIRAATEPQLLYMSPAYERLTGLPVAKLYEDLANFLAMVVHEDQRQVRDISQQNPVDNYNLVFRVYDKERNIRWLSVRGFVVRDAAGKPLRRISTAIDITSQKEKEAVLQQSLERERELNRLKSQFVATASHEFRTPLATIQSSVDLIKLYLTRSSVTSPGSIDRHLGVIEKEVAGFSELLDDMLTIGRIEAGKIPFSPQPVNLSDLVIDVIEMHFDNRPHKVAVSVAGKQRPVPVDARLIEHALVNLLANAFKFSTLPPKLQLTFGRHQVILAVVDRGIGIPADDLPNLFELFFRARNAVAIQGSGLGLAITRQFIELHGGTIAVFSEENKGTTFTITLPG